MAACRGDRRHFWKQAGRPDLASVQSGRGNLNYPAIATRLALSSSLAAATSEDSRHYRRVVGSAQYRRSCVAVEDIDGSCQDLVSEATACSPELSVGFLGREFKVPIKFRVRAAISHGNGLRVQCCDRDGAAIHEGLLFLDTEASGGELVSGWFDPGGEESLAKVYRYKIVRKVTR
jgi:hypothetical protein